MTWQFVDKIYLYDESIEGFLSVVLECIQKKEIPKDITTENQYIENLFDIPILLETNIKQSNYLTNSLYEISDWTVYRIHTGFLSGNKNKEMILFKYIVQILKYKNKLNFMRNKETIINIEKLCKQVTNEIHRLKGFLRFELIADKFLYAEIEPDHNVIEFLAKHFKERLPQENWLIYDKKRGIAAAYKEKEIRYSYIEHIEFHRNKEDIYQELWKKYFKTIAIKERKNKRCQLNFMPKRYWKNMIETKENIL